VVSEYYTQSFYEQLRPGARRSAETIAPLVLGLTQASSVVDVGCGDGTWLSVFRRLGVNDILGIDGDYVGQPLLQIPPDHFLPVELTKPFNLGRVFDLAVSLEVAEHLPPDCAPVFVECLTRAAPVVLFSAAIPFQGGEHHVNEQWPDKWAALFRTHGYVPVDFIRKHIWQNDSVEWWYAQNTLLFAQSSLIENNAQLKSEFEKTSPNQLCLVHPRQYLYLESQYRQAVTRAQQLVPPPGVRAASRLLWACLKNAFGERVYSIIGKGPRV
jgi:SAM-dependent methyltransferase